MPIRIYHGHNDDLALVENTHAFYQTLRKFRREHTRILRCGIRTSLSSAITMPVIWRCWQSLKCSCQTLSISWSHVFSDEWINLDNPILQHSIFHSKHQIPPPPPIMIETVYSQSVPAIGESRPSLNPMATEDTVHQMMCQDQGCDGPNCHFSCILLNKALLYSFHIQLEAFIQTVAISNTSTTTTLYFSILPADDEALGGCDSTAGTWRNRILLLFHIQQAGMLLAAPFCSVVECFIQRLDSNPHFNLHRLQSILALGEAVMTSLLSNPVITMERMRHERWRQ